MRKVYVLEVLVPQDPNKPVEIKKAEYKDVEQARADILESDVLNYAWGIVDLVVVREADDNDAS